jgi:hypothetical protein
MNEIITVESELVVVNIKPAEVFVPGGLDVLINEIKAAAMKEVEGLDPSIEKDRKAFGTTCRKVSSTKVFVETGMKTYVADLKAKIKPVDAERIRFVAAMEDIRREIDKPRQDYLQAEEATVALANQIMKQIQDSMVIHLGTTSADLETRVTEIENIDIEALPENYQDRALLDKNSALTFLYQQQADLQKRENEQAELAKLRQEADERRQKEEADRLAKEQADREAEIIRKAEERAKREAGEAAAKAIADARAAKEKAEKDAIEAKERAEREKREAVEEADRKERERLAEEERQKAVAEAARKAAEKKAANKKHREAVNAGIVRALHQHVGVKESDCNLIIDAINDGMIPGVTINY